MTEGSTRAGWSEQRKATLLRTVSKLRVTDVRDGLDWVGVHAQGSVSPEIRPLYRARACGFARTLRHIPTQQVVPKMTPDEYTKWAYDVEPHPYALSFEALDRYHGGRLRRSGTTPPAAEVTA